MRDLVQPYLEVDVAAADAGSVDAGPPLDVENHAAGARISRHRGVDAVARLAVGEQVVPVGEEGVAFSGLGQAGVAEGVAVGDKAQRAVGADDGGGEYLAVQAEGERQRDCGGAVVGVVADVGGAGVNYSAG